jgi:hypothetical protein
MADMIRFDEIVTEVKNLPYDDRLRLVETIVHSLQNEKRLPLKNRKRKNNEEFMKAFGIWENTNVSLASIRDKAWKRR